MAANYWASTQYQSWLFTRAQLTTLTATLADQQSFRSDLMRPNLDWQLVNIWISSRVRQLGAKVLAATSKQLVTATAVVYLRRYYLKQYIGCSNPYQVVAAAIYLASKMEECPLQMRQVVQESKSLWPDCSADTNRIGELEFSIIETLNSQLIVHHPYDNLYDLQSTLQLTKDEMIVMDCIINDQYHTDLILLNPPVIIAVAAVTVALTLQTIWTRKPAPDPSQYLSSFASSYERIGPQNQLSRSKHLASWLAESELDTQAIADCIELIIQYYQISVEQYDDHKCKNSILEAIQACESIDV